MKYLSVCSGIEAASVAFEPFGWKPLAFSEIEAFPRAVLQHHYPDTPLHGDFTDLKDESWIVDADMLCGGTPCQAFSIAGNRQSLADDRGNLTLQFVLLANAIDTLRSGAGRDPAWVLWENVPGVLSTNDNAFGAFLAGLAGEDVAFEPGPRPEQGRSSTHWTWKGRLGKHVPKWPVAGVADGPHRTVAWRVLDAQHFGLAQRRQRVFVLARGGAGRWAVADALLPIIESSRWHPAPGRGKGEGTAHAVAPSLTASGLGVERTGESRGQDPVVAHTLRAEGFDASEGGTGRGIPLVMATGQAGAEVVSDGEPSLTCNHEAPILMRMREGKEGGGKGPLVSEDQSLTLATGNDQVLAVRTANTTANGHGIADGITHTLDQAQGQAVMTGMQVRRLTPVETSRLQGFPDTYCHIPTNKWRKIPADEAAYLQSHGLHAELRGEQWYTNVAADGPIYKANGNSWAVPCARYIAERIKAVMP